MSRLLPHPLLTLVLLALWLVLNDSFAPLDLLLGVCAGVAGGALYARLRVPRAAMRRRGLAAVALLGAVLADIVRSNLAVLPIALGLRRRPRTAGFLPIPLALRDPAGLAVLACIVTATPGTSWARHDADAGLLVLHVLDLDDGDLLAAQFKHRYERRLLEIFG